MIEVGREEAKRRGLGNVRWTVGRAEDLEASPESFELVTIGEAFHRLNQRLVAKRALEWLSPGCCLAVISANCAWRGSEKWKSLVVEVIQKWAQNREVLGQPGEPFEESLRFTGFEHIQRYKFPTPYIWTLDALIGYTYSTSSASKNALGGRAEAFEADLRQTLLAYDSQGQYPETMDFGYILARKPRKK